MMYGYVEGQEGYMISYGQSGGSPIRKWQNLFIVNEENNQFIAALEKQV